MQINKKFFNQLSKLLRVNISLEKALKYMEEHESISKQSNLLSAMASKIKEGIPLSKIMSEYPSYFSSYECDIIEAGEESGDLHGSLGWLNRLNRQKTEIEHENNIALFKFVFGNILGVSILCVCIFIMVPMGWECFASFGAALPVPTQLLILISDLANNYWIPILVILILLGILFYHMWRRYPVTASLLLTNIPKIGDRWIYYEFVNFSLIFSQAMKIGVPPLKALESSAKYIAHPYLKEQLLTMKPFIEEGRAWATALESIKKFPKELLAFIQLGEDQDKLEEALMEIWNMENIEYIAKSNLFTYLTLALFITCFLLIIFMVIAMYLPIFTMAGAVGG